MFGPLAPRRPAACSYSRSFGQLSRNWEGAAQPLLIFRRLSSLFARLPPRILCMCEEFYQNRLPNLPRLCPKMWLRSLLPPPLVTSSMSTPLGLAQPAPPVPEIDRPRGCINPAVAKRASPSPSTSPVPTPSGPFTVNLSESASPPSQDPPTTGFRTPETERDQGVTSSPRST